MTLQELEIDTDTRELMGYQRKIRDPVYNYIPLTELECALIDTEVYQRLDRIGQMHSVHKVFPGAAYSRKVHSLGVVHLVGKAITRLLYSQTKLNEIVPSTLFSNRQEWVNSNPEKLDDLTYLLGVFDQYSSFDQKFMDQIKDGIGNCRRRVRGMATDEILASSMFVFQSARLLGLFHDLGHGPFSHKLEHISGVEFDHESSVPKIIEIAAEQAKDNLKSKSDIAIENFEKVVGFSQAILSQGVEDMGQMKYLRQIINHPFDCDMLDYIVRDAHFAGTPEYGKIDSDRIIKGFVVFRDRLRISKSETKALRNAFESVFDMYRAVYTHKTVRMYDYILDMAFRNITDTIRDIIETPTRLVQYDEQRFISHIQNRATDGNRFDKCLELYNVFKDRDKPYQELYQAPNVIKVDRYLQSLDVEKDENPADQLEETINDVLSNIKEKAKELNIYDHELDINAEPIIFDPAYSIRRVGLSLEDLLTWIHRDILYDPGELINDKFKSLTQIDPDIRDRLLTVEVPTRVFIAREIDIEKKRELLLYSKQQFRKLRLEHPGFKSE